MSFDPTAIPDLLGRFHPFLLHFPIGLLLWAGIVELVEAIRRQPIPANGPVSLPMVIPGACFAILAATSGWLLADQETPSSALDWHRWLGVSTAVIALATAGVGLAMVKGRWVPRNGYRVALFLCVPVLAWGGHIGGELKWGDGYIEKGFEKVFYSSAGYSDEGSSSQLAQASIDAPQEERGLRLYHELVRDTLDENCVKCHGPDKTKGELRLDIPDDLKDLTRETLIIIPGDPDQSLLVELIGLPDDDEDRMPPLEESGLSEAQQRGIAEWVRAGAPWPAEGPRGSVGPVGVEGPHLFPDEHEADKKEDDPESPGDIFRGRVQPIFEANCYECHGPDKQKSGLRLDLREAAMADREFATIIPGNAEESEMIMRVTLSDSDEDRMPPEGERLSESEVATLRSWIDSGAHWPDPEISPLPDETELEVQRPTPRGLAPGKLPDLPRIVVSDDSVRANISKALEVLRDMGVRAAPVSQIDDAHEAVFRLLRKSATDEMVTSLKGLEPVLTRLDLAGTSVTSASIRGLWRFGKLRVLNLSETAVTDDDVAVLASLTDLTVLNLFGTAVTDDCLALLERMPSLRRVYLWRTAVTNEAARQLSRVRPDLLVDNGVAPAPIPIKAPVKVETSGIWPGREEELAVDHVHDGSLETIWSGPEEVRTGWVQLTLEKPHRVVGVRLDEGEFPRIQKFTVEVQKEAGWVEVASGTTIGSKKNVLFDALEAQVFRLNILESVETPVIAEFDLLTD